MKPLPDLNKRPSLFDTETKKTVDQALLTKIAIGLWRMKNSLVIESPGSIDLETTRTWRHLQNLLARLESAGIRIQDRQGEPYDAGMALRVVSVERRTDLRTEMIIEMVTPTVFHRDTILHAGEVVIGKPEST